MKKLMVLMLVLPLLTITCEAMSFPSATRLSIVISKIGGRLSDFLASDREKTYRKIVREIDEARKEGNESWNYVVRKYGCKICQGRGGVHCPPGCQNIFSGEWVQCSMCQGTGYLICRSCGGWGFPALQILNSMLD